MFRGIITARNGMAYEQTRIDVISDNIANVNTNGFKRKVVAGKEFSPMLQQRLGDKEDATTSTAPQVGQLGFGSAVAKIGKDNDPASLVMTGLPLDFAIEGPGEFTVQSPVGTMTTRNGAFHQDEQGRLVNADGYPLLVGGQPISAPPGKLNVGVDGTVSVNGRAAGTLDMPGATQKTSIRTGWLESSNVQLSQEMTDLVEASKSFTASQRVLRSQDELLTTAISIGKL